MVDAAALVSRVLVQRCTALSAPSQGFCKPLNKANQPDSEHSRSMRTEGYDHPCIKQGAQHPGRLDGQHLQLVREILTSLATPAKMMHRKDLRKLLMTLSKKRHLDQPEAPRIMSAFGITRITDVSQQSSVVGLILYVPALKGLHLNLQIWAGK